jgi:hypothetical protein
MNNILSRRNVISAFHPTKISQEINYYHIGKFNKQKKFIWVMNISSKSSFWFEYKNRYSIMINNDKNTVLIVDDIERKYKYTFRNGKVKSISKLAKIIKKL